MKTDVFKRSKWCWDTPLLSLAPLKQSAEHLTVPNPEHRGINKAGGREDYMEFYCPFLTAVSFLFCL